MDKKVFLLDKERYTAEMVSNLTVKDLEEECVVEEEYNDDYTIIKIDANGYDSAEEAFVNEMPFADIDDYYMLAFGF